MEIYTLKHYLDFFNKNERKIEIPKHIHYLLDYSFSDNEKIIKVAIHEQVKKIGKAAFQNCINLESFKFLGESSLASIPEYCFSGCKALKSITIPEEVGIIKKFAFNDCTNISRIVIPESVISVEVGAFDKWTEQQTIEVYRNYKFGMVCKAKIINHNQLDNDIIEEDVYETYDQKYMYAVKCKCGHVGKHRYMPIDFPVTAESKKEAAEIARLIPRVKHDHKDAILEVNQLSQREFDELIKRNNENPYLKFRSKHEQKEFIEFIDKFAVPEPNYVRKS